VALAASIAAAALASSIAAGDAPADDALPAVELDASLRELSVRGNAALDDATC
jgi:hypothetical protein